MHADTFSANPLKKSIIVSTKVYHQSFQMTNQFTQSRQGDFTMNGIAQYMIQWLRRAFEVSLWVN